MYQNRGARCPPFSYKEETSAFKNIYNLNDYSASSFWLILALLARLRSSASATQRSNNTILEVKRKLWVIVARNNNICLFFVCFARLASCQMPNFHCIIKCNVRWILCDIFLIFCGKAFYSPFWREPFSYKWFYASIKVELLSSLQGKLLLVTSWKSVCS